MTGGLTESADQHPQRQLSATTSDGDHVLRIARPAGSILRVWSRPVSHRAGLDGSREKCRRPAARAAAV